MLSRIIITMATCLFFVVGFASTASAQCANGEATCSGECVDLQEDDDNCGGCGKTCERYEACVRGSCKLMCPDKQLACGNVCVTAASNPNHCGGCGKKCASNQYCAYGKCMQATCPDPKKVDAKKNTKTNGKTKPKPQTKKHTYKKTNSTKSKAR